MGRLVENDPLQRLPRLGLLCNLSHHRPYVPPHLSLPSPSN
jgi:hypothetical protein